MSQEEEGTFLLVGEVGVGKTTTLNVIEGAKNHQTGDNPEGITTEPSIGAQNNIRFVDTMGLNHNSSAAVKDQYKMSGSTMAFLSTADSIQSKIKKLTALVLFHNATNPRISEDTEEFVKLTRSVYGDIPLVVHFNKCSTPDCSKIIETVNKHRSTWEKHLGPFETIFAKMKPNCKSNDPFDCMDRDHLLTEYQKLASKYKQQTIDLPENYSTLIKQNDIHLLKTTIKNKFCERVGEEIRELQKSLSEVEKRDVNSRTACTMNPCKMTERTPRSVSKGIKGWFGIDTVVYETREYTCGICVEREKTVFDACVERVKEETKQLKEEKQKQEARLNTEIQELQNSFNAKCNVK